MGRYEIGFKFRKSPAGFNNCNKVLQRIHRTYQMRKNPDRNTRVQEDICQRAAGSGKNGNLISFVVEPEGKIPNMNLSSSDGIGPGYDKCNVHICKISAFL
jgi:hypothetical protein